METREERIITKEQVAAAVAAAIPRLACVLPPDVRAGLEAAQAVEEHPRGRVVLDQLCENARIAENDRVPLCQDTGTVWVSLEIGPDVCVRGDVFADVDAAVARAYGEARLRKSVVRDALFDRTNTGDNTPAFCDLHPVDEPGAARLHVMLKGGGSDNASRVVMLPPGAGRAGVVAEVVRCVREKGANACPPLVVGVGVGATFDKVAGLAKRALMRPVDEPAADGRLAAFEDELLEAVNATGTGPGGLGGTQTALAVRVATAPCHIAALPVAINMGCSAMRRVTVDFSTEQGSRASGGAHQASSARLTVQRTVNTPPRRPSGRAGERLSITGSGLFVRAGLSERLSIAGRPAAQDEEAPRSEAHQPAVGDRPAAEGRLAAQDEGGAHV